MKSAARTFPKCPHGNFLDACDALCGSAPAEPRVYRIIRFRQSGARPRTVRNHVTLSEARAHCRQVMTHGPGWFDGYDYMRGCAPRREGE